MKKTLPFEASGKKDSKTLVVLLHGWPDSVRLWDATIAQVKDEDAQFLNISYPNYHPAETLRFGQSLETIVDRVKATVDFVVAGRPMKKIFVTHDWGALFGYLLVRPLHSSLG